MGRGTRMIAAALLASAMGCEDEPEAPATTPEAVQQQVDEASEALDEATAALPADMGERACVFFTEPLVRDALDLGESVTLTQNVGRASCSYSWEREMSEAQRQELEERRREAMQKMMKQVRSGMRAQGIADAMQMPSTTARVAMNFSTREFDDAEAAASGFEQAMRVLEGGISGMVGDTDEEVTFQASHETVEGVGDQAAWSSRLKQLSVQAGDQLFFVNVELLPDPDANLPKAKALAEAVVDAL